MVTIKTPAKKIREIDRLYHQLHQKIADIFLRNNFEIKDRYFTHDYMFGGLQFLRTWVDVYKGIEPLLPTINDFISMNHRVRLIALKHGITLKKEFFDDYQFQCLKPLYSLEYTFKWNFCGENVTAKNSDAELEQILIRNLHCFNQPHEETTAKKINDAKLNQIRAFRVQFDSLNQRVNVLLKSIRYPLTNQLRLHLSTGQEFYMTMTLFTVVVTSETPDAVILEIIHNAQLFENRVRQITKKLKIRTKYRIEYQYTKIQLTLGLNDYEFKLDSDYDEINTVLQKCKELYPYY